MPEPITRVLREAAEERHPEAPTAELWRLGRRARRRRRTALTGVGVVAALTFALGGVGYLTTLDHTGPDRRGVAAVPDSPTPKSKNSKRSPTWALYAGVRPPVRTGDDGQPEMLLSTVLGETFWVTVPPWLDANMLQATPDLPVTVTDYPWTARLSLTVADRSDIEWGICPHKAGCVRQDTIVHTGVGDWSVVISTGNADERKRLAEGMSFSPGRSGFLRLVIDSPDVRLHPRSSGVLVRGPREGAWLDVDAHCTYQGDEPRTVEGPTNAMTFCAGGLGFVTADQPRSVVEEYARTVTVTRD